MATPNTMASGSQSAWRRFWQRLAPLEEAMSVTHDDMQDRRLEKLERELSAVKTALDRAQSHPAEQARVER